MLNTDNQPKKLNLTSNTPTQTSQEPVQSTEQPQTAVDTTPTQTTTTDPSTTPTTTTDPAPAPTIDQLTKQYALDQGETDYQAGCFYKIINYRTNWNITETDMHDKFASVKATYPSLCAAWNVVSRNTPDAPLKGL